MDQTLPTTGAVLLGGTRTECAAGTGDGAILRHEVFATEDPERTLACAAAFFAGGPPVARLGVGSFGPLDLTAGRLSATTPKLAWRGFPLRERLEQALGVPVRLVTDVTAEGLAEAAAEPATPTCLVYVTVGTGVGGGVIVGGRALPGATHPELGHLRPPRHPSDRFEGLCPSHGDCLEGLASGPAVAARWAADPADLPPDHPAWELEAWYLGHGLASVVAVLGPQIIVCGGGLMQAAGLLERVRLRLEASVGGYVPLPVVRHPRVEGRRAGVVGGLLLAGGP